MISLIIQVLLLILLSDFITGHIHWWEDVYGNPNWKFLSIGKYVVLPNLEHHKYPRKLVEGSFWGRIKISFFFSIFILFIIYLINGSLNWQTIFLLLYSSLGNELHAASHRTDKENGKLICLIQKTGLIQSRKMHGLHHTSPYNINYCVMTNYLNPLLNKIKYFEKLEWFISLLGIKPLRGTELRNGL